MPQRQKGANSKLLNRYFYNFINFLKFCELVFFVTLCLSGYSDVIKLINKKRKCFVVVLIQVNSFR